MIPTLDIGALQRPPAGEWVEQLLGFVIIFFAVFWPLIQRALEAAKSKRAEFEREVRRRASQAGSGESAGGRRRPTLDELLRGEVPTEARSADALEDLEEVRSQGAPPPLPPSRRRPEPDLRDRQRPAPRAPRIPDAESPRHRDLVGDPFDEAQMNRDLVSPAALEKVPTEDELEGRFDEAAAARRLRAAGDARQAAKAPDRANTSLAALRRLERTHTPWQRAFVLREVLGPPRAEAPHGRFDPRR